MRKVWLSPIVVSLGKYILISVILVLICRLNFLPFRPSAYPTCIYDLYGNHVLSSFELSKGFMIQMSSESEIKSLPENIIEVHVYIQALHKRNCLLRSHTYKVDSIYCGWHGTSICQGLKCQPWKLYITSNYSVNPSWWWIFYGPLSWRASYVCSLRGCPSHT